jgi:hypothetical protein
MPDLKISQLPSVAGLDGSEQFPVNDSGTTRKALISQLFASSLFANHQHRGTSGDGAVLSHDSLANRTVYEYVLPTCFDSLSLEDPYYLGYGVKARDIDASLFDAQTCAASTAWLVPQDCAGDVAVAFLVGTHSTLGDPGTRYVVTYVRGHYIDLDEEWNYASWDFRTDPAQQAVQVVQGAYKLKLQMLYAWYSLPGAVPGKLVHLEFWRDGADAQDTLNDDLEFFAFIFRYTRDH